MICSRIRSVRTPDATWSGYCAQFDGTVTEFAAPAHKDKPAVNIEPAIRTENKKGEASEDGWIQLAGLLRQIRVREVGRFATRKEPRRLVRMPVKRSFI